MCGNNNCQDLYATAHPAADCCLNPSAVPGELWWGNIFVYTALLSSERRLGKLERLVCLQCELWRGEQEPEQELRQSRAGKRRQEL